MGHVEDDPDWDAFRAMKMKTFSDAGKTAAEALTEDLIERFSEGRRRPMC